MIGLNQHLSHLFSLDDQRERGNIVLHDSQRTTTRNHLTEMVQRDLGVKAVLMWVENMFHFIPFTGFVITTFLGALKPLVLHVSFYC